ncbi:DUF5071 domain-containing protein [bacterium]|nr:DUF5071 domain-containing protein [bacterium]
MAKVKNVPSMQVFKSLIPDGPDDFAAVERIKKAEWVNLEIVLAPILMCLQDTSWPIFKPLCEVLKGHSFGLIPQLKVLLYSWHTPAVINILKELVVKDWQLCMNLKEQLFTLTNHWEPELARLTSECIEEHKIYGSIQSAEDLVPRDKFDYAAAWRIRHADPQMVEPVLDEILKWLQDFNWPIFSTVVDSVKTLGIMLVPHLKKIMVINDGAWKLSVMKLIEDDENLCAALKGELKFVANTPFEDDRGWEVDIRAKELLERYHLND